MNIPITPAELGRVHTESYQGLQIQVILCLSPASPNALSINSTTAQCVAAELASANGYARHVVASLAAGAWDGVNLRYAAPEIAAGFAATGAGFTYDTLVVLVAAAASPYSVVALGSQTLAAGQSRTYPLTIAQKSVA